MAAIAEETEAERKLREQQEAIAEMEQLLASQIVPPQLPQEAIPADNVAFTNGASGQIQIDAPESFAPMFDRQMIGDERYMQEVARAQRGSGFIQGYGSTPTYDPAIAEAAQRRLEAQAAQQAKRFTGVQKFQSLINNGATREEAFALAGADMFYNDPAAYRAQVLKPTLSSLNPEVTTVDGVKMYRTGRNSFAQARPEAPLRPPLETVAGQKILTGQITDARNTLERAEKKAAEEQDAASVNAALRARSKLRGLEDNFMRGSTNWMNRPAPAPQAAAPAKADEQVVVTKDGRRYSLPKSQLEEALKAGYKQGQ